MSCKQVMTYFSVDSDVYHKCGNCTIGDNIEPGKTTAPYASPGLAKSRRCSALLTPGLQHKVCHDFIHDARSCRKYPGSDHFQAAYGELLAGWQGV
jgi:hypothetical protein